MTRTNELVKAVSQVSTPPCIMSVEYTGECSIQFQGRISLSTMEMFNTPGDIMSTPREYNEDCGTIS